MSQQETDETESKNNDTKPAATDNANNDNANNNNANDQPAVSKDDMKDNSNDEEKKYESQEDIANRQQTEIPQNLEPKPLGKKNKIVIGSFEPSTFHYSFKNQKDPLQIGMFPMFGYLHIPHVGVYGDSYEPTQLKALLELSLTEQLISELPKSVNSAMKQLWSKVPHGQFDGYVVIHNCPPYKETQHFGMNANNLFNVMYHAWFYNSIQDLSNEQQIEGSLVCGLFEPCNVYEIRNDADSVKSVVDRGVPFNRLEERSCFLHGFAFSPCNNDVARDTEAGYCAFYMIAHTKDLKRACLSYHVFANNGDMDEILKWTFKEIQTVKELMTAFHSLQWGNVAANLERLCSHNK